MIRLPLRRKDGSVRAYGLISDEDAPLAAYRWRMIGWGHVARNDYSGQKVRCVRLAREVLGLTPGDPREADHINGDVLDNRRENLRIVTRQQNAQNLSSHRDARSRHRGVDWSVRFGKWRARARIAGTDYHLGYFDDEDAAGAAATAFRAEHMPFSVETSERHALTERTGNS